jgi:carbamoyl-phosphate synthase/aspartate carbamoyltransferase/dihydroorotase
MLPLLLTAVRDGKLKLSDIIERLHDNPRQIFQLPAQPNTYIEVDTSDEWTIPVDGGHSKAGWSPYAGRKVCGRVRTVVIRGEEVYVDGSFVASPGVGKNVRKERMAAKTRPPIAEKPKRQVSGESSESPARSLSPYRPMSFQNLLYNRNLLSVADVSKPVRTPDLFVLR